MSKKWGGGPHGSPPIRKEICMNRWIGNGIRFLFLAFFIQNSQSHEILTANTKSLQQTDSSIRQMELRVQKNYKDYFGYSALGKLYYQKARLTGDIQWYPRAESALLKAAELNPAFPSVAIDLAEVYSAMHRFEEALKYADRAANASPENPEILAVLADASLELGDYEKTFIICARLLAIAPDDPSVLARQARLEELHGRPEKAAELIHSAIEKGKSQFLGRQQMAWFYARLGQLHALTGNWDEAQSSLNASLRLVPDYQFAVVALANLLEMKGKFNDAIHVLKESRVANVLPGAMITLGKLYAKTGNQKRSEQLFQAAEKLFTTSALHRSIFAREYAYYCAEQKKDLKEILQFAERDLLSRKDIAAYDLLAWVLYHMERFEEAAVTMEKALRLNTRNPELYRHATVIFRAAGRETEANQYASLMGK
jgi:tetratricopeptide (TPR) repeat protein